MESAGLIAHKNDQHMSFMFQVFVGQLCGKGTKLSRKMVYFARGTADVPDLVYFLLEWDPQNRIHALLRVSCPPASEMGRLGL